MRFNDFAIGELNENTLNRIELASGWLLAAGWLAGFWLAAGWLANSIRATADQQ